MYKEKVIKMNIVNLQMWKNELKSRMKLIENYDNKIFKIL